MPVPRHTVFLTAEKAAEVAGCTSTWIRRLLKSGRLPGVQMCGWTWMIDERDVIKLRDTLTTRAKSRRDDPPKKPHRRAS